MAFLKIAIFLALTCVSVHGIGGNGTRVEDCETGDDKPCNDPFPPGFVWGYATAAYQIEGGHNADGKGESIWDAFTHRVFPPSPIADGTNGDVACNSYNFYEKDVKLLNDSGANFYRFSISWSRVIPDGEGEVNQPGIDYYNKLINALLAEGITPFVTMYHWDLPQALQAKYGGWPSEEIVPHFENYARVLYENFGDRVKHWMTFNEPWNTCEAGYGLSIAAPGHLLEATQPYLCAHTILKSHARAYRLYDEKYRRSQNGQVGIVIDSEWMEPEDSGNIDDVVAAERARRFKHGWFGFPVFFGDYPPEMREFVDRASFLEGRNESRLPTFDEYWQNQLRGSLDFLGVNHYTTYLTSPQASCGFSGWSCDQLVSKRKDTSWPQAASKWLRSYPPGIRRLLKWIKYTYNSPVMYITENGWSDPKEADASYDDSGRADYHRAYLTNVLKAILLDECDIRGYTVWTLMDNFEWVNGLTHRFGVHHVDFTSDERTRTPKATASVLLKQIFTTNRIPPAP